MPQFEVRTRSDGWLEAECRELGILITAKTLANVEETARRTAARAKKDAVFAYKLAPVPPIEGLFHWLSKRIPGLR